MRTFSQVFLIESQEHEKKNAKLFKGLEDFKGVAAAQGDALPILGAKNRAGVGKPFAKWKPWPQLPSGKLT